MMNDRILPSSTTLAGNSLFNPTSLQQTLKKKITETNRTHLQFLQQIPTRRLQQRGASHFRRHFEGPHSIEFTGILGDGSDPDEEFAVS